MIKNLLTNWKTSSLGITMIVGAIVHLYFARPLDETKVMLAVGAILGGIGLLAAGDGISNPPATPNKPTTPTQ